MCVDKPSKYELSAGVDDLVRRFGDPRCHALDKAVFNEDVRLLYSLRAYKRSVLNQSSHGVSPPYALYKFSSLQ